jgi:hypothetical protein
LFLGAFGFRFAPSPLGLGRLERQPRTIRQGEEGESNGVCPAGDFVSLANGADGLGGFFIG